MNRLIEILFIAMAIACLVGFVFSLRDKHDQQNVFYDCRIITPDTPEKIKQNCIKQGFVRKSKQS